MSYSPMLEREVGYLVSVADYDQIRENFAAGIPDIYTQKGQIGGATDNQTMEPVTPTADNQALVCDSSEVTGMKFNSGTVPIGTIILWSGSVGSIPNGWALCDGNNGTPDLRGKMVVGAGNSYAAGDNGSGNNLEHTHTPNAANTDSGGSAHSHTQGATGTSSHSHTDTGVTGGPSATTTVSATGTIDASASGHTHTWGNTNPETVHTHSNPNSDSGGAAHTHSLGNLNSALSSYLPPYYSLAFIMRIS